MARLPRKERPGGIHHVFNHAVTGGVLYRDDDDRRFFLQAVEDVVHRHEWRCLSFCLMDNHFHMLVETPQPDLGRGMQRVQGRHAQRYRERHGGRGAVFESRFKSVPVERESYLLHLFRYIALNPVNASRCSDPTQWRWSGHRGLLQRVEDPLHASGRVRELLDEAVGSPTVDGYETLFDVSGPHGPWTTAATPRPPRPSLASLLTWLPQRQALMAARWEHGYRLEEIAVAAGLSRTTVSQRTKYRSDKRDG